MTPLAVEWLDCREAGVKSEMKEEPWKWSERGQEQEEGAVR